MKFNLTCSNCYGGFVATRANRKYCSLKCAATANAATKSNASRLTKSCECCRGTFEVTKAYARLRFCSKLCAKTQHRVGRPAFASRLCETCGTHFLVRDKLRTQRFCDRSCASRLSWNLGLRAATCEKLRDIGQCSGATRAQMIVDGELDIVTRGNAARHESQKGSCLCRSSYEKRYCELLDKDVSVVSYRAEPQVIEYQLNSTTRHYIPDFMVTRADGSRQLVEVKPASLVETPQNAAKAVAAKRWCEEHGVAYVVVTENELDEPTA